MKSHRSIRRETNYISVTILIALCLILSNGFFISALAAEQPIQPIEGNHTGAAPESTSGQNSGKVAAQLDFTPAFTLYFPLVADSSRFNGGLLTPAPPPGSSPKKSSPSCNPSKGSGGLKPGIYERKVGPLRATIVISKKYKPNKPTYLAFYLHGDDGNYKKFQKPKNPVTEFVEDQGWIFIAPRSSHPNLHWYLKADRQVKELDKVFQKMFAKYNLCRNIIIGASISGGSTFISGHFFPDRGKKYPMHVNLVCLGWTDKDARRKIRKLGQDPKVVARSSFRFTYGDKDRFLEYIIPTIKVYRRAGFHVTVERFHGVKHCMPKVNKKIRNNWRKLAKSLDLK